MSLPAKIPTAWAAAELARVCDEMDGADTIDAFLDQFEDATLTLGESVDRRIAVDRELKSQILAQEESYRWYRARKELLEAIQARFKERTKKIMEEADPGVVEAFRGKLGKISLCNSPPSIEYSFGGKDIDPETAIFFGVDSTYLIAKMTYKIDSERVKSELLAGGTLEWASLKTGKHVRFPAAPKAKEIEA